MNFQTYDKAVFCKTCKVLVGYDAHDEEGYVWVPMISGGVSVSGLGTYCSEEHKNDDPDYRAAMDDAAAAGQRMIANGHRLPPSETPVVCRCGHPPEDHINLKENCGAKMGRCGCPAYRRVA